MEQKEAPLCDGNLSKSSIEPDQINHKLEDTLRLAVEPVSSPTQSG